jgi:PAS domain S-box-containing protein
MPEQPDNRQLYNSMLTAFDVLNLNYFVMEIVCDKKGKPVDGIYREVSPATERLIGKSKEQIIGKSRRQLFGNITDEFPSKTYTVLQTGQPAHFQSFGSALKKFYDVYAWKVADNQVGVIVIDITERRKAEEALKESETRFRDLFSSMTEMFQVLELIHGENGKVIDYYYRDINPAFERLVHKTREQIVNKRAKELFDVVEDYWIEVYNRVLRTGNPEHFENYGRELDKYYEIYVWKTDKNLVAVIFTDITERKKAEKALELSEESARQRAEELQKLMDIIPVAIWVSNDPECKVIVGNQTANRFYEAKGGENVSAGPASGREKDATRQFFKDGKELLPQELPMQKAAKENREIKNSELEVLAPSGRKMTILGSAKPLLNAEGNVRGCIAAFIDITERKELENKLEEHTKNLETLVEQRTQKLSASEQYARSLIEASLDPLVTISADGKITDVNQATERVTGCSREELIGSDFTDYFTEPEKAEAGYKRVFADGFVKDYQLTIKNKSGKTTDVLYNASVYRNEAGEIHGVFAAARDITERKNLEKQLQDKERLAAIGATAGMVGHDIRNPLQSIMSDTYLLKDDLAFMPQSETKDGAAESIDNIEKNISYINKIVADLQDYSRPLKPEYTLVNLYDLATSIFRPIGIPDNISPSIEIDPAISFKTDSTLFTRILSNLIINAIQAMPDGGELTIKALKTHNDISISVEDTGVGIPDHVKPKLFTPMMTTKSKGQGLGLAVVKRLVEAMNGTVNFESTEGKGTKFIIELPTNT